MQISTEVKKQNVIKLTWYYTKTIPTTSMCISYWVISVFSYFKKTLCVHILKQKQCIFSSLHHWHYIMWILTLSWQVFVHLPLWGFSNLHPVALGFFCAFATMRFFAFASSCTRIFFCICHYEVFAFASSCTRSFLCIFY